MRISLYPCVLIKAIPWNLAFLILRILELSFLKSRLICNIFYCLWILQTNFSHISRLHISKSKRCFNVKFPTCYFHMKTKILADFQICISVPLRLTDFYCLNKSTIYHHRPNSQISGLRGKCPNTELFLVRIFLYSDQK